MGGNNAGAIKAAQTQKHLYGPDHFAVIGAAGGRKSKGKHRSEETKRKISETIKRKKLIENGTNDNDAVR